MGFPAVDDLTRLLSHGPSSGIALSIIAVGSAILILAWRALPVYKAWKQAILEMRGNQLRQSARLHALAEQAQGTEGRVALLAAEVARLEARLGMVKAEVGRLASPTPAIPDPQSSGEKPDSVEHP